MTGSNLEVAAKSWKEIASVFLRLGFTAYGGPAIMGIMQAELVEKRQWVSKERFVEGLSLVNMLPGAGATQLGIFLGYCPLWVEKSRCTNEQELSFRWLVYDCLGLRVPG